MRLVKSVTSSWVYESGAHVSCRSFGTHQSVPCFCRLSPLVLLVMTHSSLVAFFVSFVFCDGVFGNISIDYTRFSTSQGVITQRWIAIWQYCQWPLLLVSFHKRPFQFELAAQLYHLGTQRTKLCHYGIFSSTAMISKGDNFENSNWKVILSGSWTFIKQFNKFIKDSFEVTLLLNAMFSVPFNK